MKQVYSLIAAAVLVGVAPLALADDTFDLMPELGGAETTQYVDVNVKADKSGINAPTTSDEFWYAGTSGVSSN